MSFTKRVARALPETKKAKSKKVDAFFAALGVVAGTPKEHFTARVTKTVAAIESDIAVLDLVPGMQVQAGQARARLNAANASRKEENLQGSLLELNAMQAELHQQVAAQRALMIDGLSSSGKQQKAFETAHEKLLELASDLAAIPCASAQAMAANWSVTQADARSRAGDLTGALDFLTRGITAATEAKSTWSKANKSAADAFEPVVKALTAVKTKLDAGKATLQSDVTARLAAEHAALLERMVLKRPVEKKGDKDFKGQVLQFKDQLLQAVAELDGKVDTLVTPAVRLKQTAERQLRAIETALAEGGSAQPASDAAEAQKGLITIRSYIAERDFAAAATLSETLAGKLVAWKVLPADPAAQAKIVGARFKAPAEAELVRAKAFAAQVGTIPVLDTPPAASQIVELLEAQLAAYAQEPAAFTLSNGLEALKQAQAANARNDERKAAYTALDAARTKGAAAVTAASAVVTQALADLKQSVGTDGVKPPLPSLDGVLQAALADWAAASKTALTEADLRSADIVARLDALKKQIAEIAADPAKLAGKKREGVYAVLADRFATARTAVDGKVTALLEADFAAGDAQRSAVQAANDRFLAAVKALDPAKAGDEIAKLDAIAAAAVAATQAAATKVGEMRQAFGVARDSIGKDLAALEHKADKAHAGQVAKLLATLSDLAAIGASGDASVLGEGVDQLYALRGDVNAMLGLFDPSKRVAGAVTVDTLASRATVLAATFKDDKVSKLEPAALAALQARLAAEVAQIGDVRLAQSTAALDAIAADWTALKATAAKGALAQAAFLAKATEAADLLGLGVVLPNCPDYEAALKGRLTSLMALCREGKTDQPALDDVLAEIAEARLHTDAAQRGQGQAETDALKAVISAKRWEADYTAFKGKLKALDMIRATLDGISKSNFEEQLEALTQKASAIDHDKKTTPYETMAEQLQRLVANADTMIRYPMGQATHARGELLKVDARWNAAAAGFNAKLDALAKAVAEAAGAGKQPEAAAAAVAAKVGEVKRLVTPGMITPLIQAVIAAKHDMSAARDAREAALREVNRMSRVVSGHPRLMQVSVNPFGVDLTEPVANLRAALFDLDTNLLISL